MTAGYFRNPFAPEFLLRRLIVSAFLAIWGGLLSLWIFSIDAYRMSVPPMPIPPTLYADRFWIGFVYSAAALVMNYGIQWFRNQNDLADFMMYPFIGWITLNAALLALIGWAVPALYGWLYPHLGPSLVPPPVYIIGVALVGALLGSGVAVSRVFYPARPCPKCGLTMSAPEGALSPRCIRAAPTGTRIPDALLYHQDNEGDTWSQLIYVCMNCQTEYLAQDFFESPAEVRP